MELDATFWATVGLVIFLGLIVYLKVPGKMMASLDQHSDKIREELDEARRLREEAQDVLAAYQRRYEEAEDEADEIISKAKRAADDLVRDTEAKAKALLARKERQVKDRIQQVEQEAIADLRARAADASVNAAQALLESSVKGAVATKLIDESVEEIRVGLN